MTTIPAVTLSLFRPCLHPHDAQSCQPIRLQGINLGLYCPEPRQQHVQKPCPMGAGMKEYPSSIFSIGKCLHNHRTDRTRCEGTDFNTILDCDHILPPLARSEPFLP